MLASIFNRLSESSITSALAGAMVYTLSQHSFSGRGKVIAFIISFIMGGVGADMTADIISEYLPQGIRGDRNIGAFVCSALVVTVTVKIISYVDELIVKKDHDVSQGLK